MLTPTTMGYVALWILWGNTLLVALAAGQRAWVLVRRARARAVLQGTALGNTALAQHTVMQTGRIGSADDPTILWHDRGYESRVLGGELLLADGRRVDVPACAEGAIVWLNADAMDGSASCPDPERFSSAYADARRVKGFARSVVAAIDTGAQVFVAGSLRQTAEGWSIEPAHGELLISTFDPGAWARQRALLVFGAFIPTILACAAACTGLALSEPVFESIWSKLGGLLGFVFFLLVLPAGTALRDHLREPHQRILRGRWVGAREQLQSVSSAT